MRVLRFLCGPVFIAAGVNHFVMPKVYKRIMPPYVPAHQEMIYASGVAEIVGGAALMHPRTRRFGEWWLIATLAAVFPANLHMALNPQDFPDIPGGAVSLWARLPFQAVFIAWVRAAAKPA
jgi:uncharacterized membrane protein